MIIEESRRKDKDVSRLELHICDSGFARLGTDWRAENVVSPFSRLYLVQSGKGVLESGGSSILLQAGFCYLIPAGQRLSFHCTEPIEKLFFHISIPKPSGYDILQNLGRIAALPMKAGQFSRMLELYRSEALLDSLLLKQELFSIIGEFLTAFPFSDPEKTSLSPLVSSALSHVRSHLSARLTIGDIAEALFVSRSFLSRQFLEEMGYSLSRYMDDQLLLAAQWQLQRSNDSIGQISERLGYRDQFYFSRRFKQLCGFTPSEYRTMQMVREY